MDGDEVRPGASGIVELPAHEFLRRKMALAGISAPTLAKDLGVHVQTLYNVTSQKRPISPSLALKLSKRFVEPAETWLSDPIKVTAGEMLEMALNEKRARGRGSAGVEGPDLFGDARLHRAARQDHILIDREIRDLLAEGRDVRIEPFRPELVQPASYDLTAGLIILKGFKELSEHDWVLVLKLETDQALKPHERSYIEAQLARKKESIDYKKEQVELEHLKSAVILMREMVRFGPDYMAEVGSTATNSLHGLLVNHGTQVDPGYSGPMYVSVMNIFEEPFILFPDQKVITLTVRQLARAPEKAYRDDIGARVLKIAERIDAGLKRQLICAALPDDDGWMAEGPAFEGAIHGMTEEDALGRAVETILERLGKADEPDSGHEMALGAITKVLHDITIERHEAQAALEFFFITDDQERRRILQLFRHTEDRQRMTYILSALRLDPAVAVISMFNGEAFRL